MCHLATRFCGIFGVAVEIIQDVWCCYGDSMGYLVLLWKLYRMFGVAMEILWVIWCCCRGSIGCLVLLWRFYGMFGGTTGIL
jgi:hypothetical protein